MKKIVFAFCLVIGVSWPVLSQSFIYNRYGEKINLNIDYTHLVFSINDNVSQDMIEKVHKKIDSNFTGHEVVEISPLHFILENDVSRIHSFRESLNSDSLYTFFSELIITEDSTMQWCRNSFFVKTKNSCDIFNFLLEYNIPYFSYSQFGPDSNTFLVSITSFFNKAIEYSNLLFESGMCVFAQPDFCRLAKPCNPYYGGQWGINNTGQYGNVTGIDINAPEAWNTSTGSGVRVAVIDEGVDLTHPDLSNNMLFGYDATDAYYGGANGSCLSKDYHGSCCAGIIASENNTIGVVGVAYDSKLISTRIAYSLPGISHIWETSDSWIADGIYKSWDSLTADILSNSWYFNTEPEIITDAFEYATTYGRAGKGSVVVACAGNDNQNNIWYPANLNSIICVGAISPCGERKNYTSCDGENNWGSNYGSSLDVMAPGVIISTTDNQGGNGFNPNYSNNDYSNMDYTSKFGGTSAACPHVSGVAALMLSANNSLTAGQVARIIKGTAQKVGNYNYQYSADHLNGTWDIEMGHGLVDAAAAVSAAESTPNFDLYIRDNATDNGAEPNTTTGSVTSSPDIIVTDLNDNVVTGLNSGVSYKIKVTVHNTGAATALFVPTMVKVHWTCESNNLQWENSWTNAGTLCGVSKSGTVTLPANGFYLMQNISPNGSVTVTIPWTTPNYLGFQCVSYYGSNLTMSLVAEVVDGGLTIGKTASDYPLEHYVRTNNNVARKNYSMLITFTYGRIILSPNPTTGRAVVSCELSDEISEATVTISDMTGHCVSTFNVTHSSAERSVDMDNFPTGQYLVQLIYQGNVLDVKQLVVE